MMMFDLLNRTPTRHRQWRGRRCPAVGFRPFTETGERFEPFDRPDFLIVARRFAFPFGLKDIVFAQKSPENPRRG
jgi:hypothetical protein